MNDDLNDQYLHLRAPAPTAEELDAERRQREALLGTLEAQQAELERRRQEEERIRAKQVEIAALKQWIQEVRALFNASGGAGGDCEAIVARVEEKERQAVELARLRRWRWRRSGEVAEHPPPAAQAAGVNIHGQHPVAPSTRGSPSGGVPAAGHGGRAAGVVDRRSPRAVRPRGRGTGPSPCSAAPDSTRAGGSYPASATCSCRRSSATHLPAIDRRPRRRLPSCHCPPRHCRGEPLPPAPARRQPHSRHRCALFKANEQGARPVVDDGPGRLPVAIRSRPLSRPSRL